MGALVTQQDGTKPTKRRNRALTTKARNLVELVAAGCLINVAARQAGMSDRQARRVMARPDVHQGLHDKAVRDLSLAKPMAATALIGLAKQSESRKVQMEAASRILSIGNIRPPSANVPPAVQVNLGMLPGFVITTREDRARFNEAKAKGLVDVSGYVVDFGPPDDEPEHQQDGAEQGPSGD